MVSRNPNLDHNHHWDQRWGATLARDWTQFRAYSIRTGSGSWATRNKITLKRGLINRLVCRYFTSLLINPSRTSPFSSCRSKKQVSIINTLTRYTINKGLLTSAIHASVSKLVSMSLLKALQVANFNIDWAALSLNLMATAGLSTQITVIERVKALISLRQAPDDRIKANGSHAYLCVVVLTWPSFFNISHNSLKIGADNFWAAFVSAYAMHRLVRTFNPSTLAFARSHNSSSFTQSSSPYQSWINKNEVW